MNWCCLTFKSRYDAAGDVGLAVLAGKGSTGSAEFILQHRILPKGMESEMDSELHLPLVSETRIHYCPWCGRDLGKWYGKHIDALDRPNLKILIPGLDF